MCYSAQIHEAYALYCRKWGAEIDLPTFVRLYGQRHEASRIRIPHAVDRLCEQPATDDERAIKVLAEQFDAAGATRLETELFATTSTLQEFVCRSSLGAGTSLVPWHL